MKRLKCTYQKTQQRNQQLIAFFEKMVVVLLIAIICALTISGPIRANANMDLTTSECQESKNMEQLQKEESSNNASDEQQIAQVKKNTMQIDETNNVEVEISNVLKADKDELQNESIDENTAENSEKNLQVVQERSEPNEEETLENVDKCLNKQNEEALIVNMSVTAYCPGECCNGKWAGVTASGEKMKPWTTVAAGNAYPLGTRIYIPYFKDEDNEGWFIVQDRFADNSNPYILDILLENHTACGEFGRKNLEVYVYM